MLFVVAFDFALGIVVACVWFEVVVCFNWLFVLLLHFGIVVLAGRLFTVYFVGMFVACFWT